MAGSVLDSEWLGITSLELGQGSCTWSGYSWRQGMPEASAVVCGVCGQDPRGVEQP